MRLIELGKGASFSPIPNYPEQSVLTPYSFSFTVGERKEKTNPAGRKERRKQDSQFLPTQQASKKGVKGVKEFTVKA